MDQFKLVLPHTTQVLWQNIHKIRKQKKMYCSTECTCKSTQDNKAKYQRKRRKLINSGELVSNETRKIGTIHFPEKIGDWVEELKRIKYAKRKAGII